MPSAAPTPSTLDRFAADLRGELLAPDTPGYHEARRLWNGMIDKRPALIVRCKGAADVMDAVNFAREEGLTVAVHGGGHNVAGLAGVDDGLMIDLSPMNAVQVDPEARIARVQGGAVWADVDHETQALGLATPSGIISSTGVAGLTLGGGFGWLSRKYGLTADNLRSVSLVTAQGELLVAHEDDRPELLWALRGGGGNFGIVTSFDFALHEVGPEVLYGPTVYRLEDAREVLRYYRSFAETAPDECTVYPDLLTAPPLPFLPEEAHGATALFMTQMYAGDPERGEEVLRPLREFGDPLGDGVAPTLYAEAQRRGDPLFPKGGRYYWKSENVTELSDRLIDTIVDAAEVMPTDLCDILIQQFGGKIAEFPSDETAYPHRDAAFVVSLGGRCEEPHEDDMCIEWAREWHGKLSEYAGAGVYVNFLSAGENSDRVRAAFGRNADRLARIKAHYDPDNFFHRNQNIEPHPGGEA